jgi:hypothetical protein
VCHTWSCQCTLQLLCMSAGHIATAAIQQGATKVTRVTGDSYVTLPSVTNMPPDPPVMMLGEHFLQLRGHCVTIHKLSLPHKPVNAKYGHTLMSS